MSKDTLLNRIRNNFASRNVAASPELLTYAEHCDKYSIGDISSCQMQTAICTYLDSSAIRTRSLSEVLGRMKEPSISEVMTESVTMLIDSIVRMKELSHLDLTISSERNVRLLSGAYRKPDVGIWKNERLVTVIECKTCLGRRRKEWIDDYNSRAKEFESIGLSTSSLLLFVGTDNTWKGFPQGDDRICKTWFSLCPSGTWYGGGKAGEVSLASKQHLGTIESFRKIVFSMLLK
jgi:hypothetical protein